MKGAADALCNPEAGVPGQITGQAAGGAGLGGNPSHDAPEGLGPQSPAGIQDDRQKVDPRSATIEAVSWKARLRVSTSWKTSATEGEAEER